MQPVLALDLEGTLISNAISQIPRPGLYEFLAQASSLFPRIVIFTAVPEDIFRHIARELVSSRDVPDWFAQLEYIKWAGHQKDLRYVEDAEIENVWLIDDYEGYVPEDQKRQWIAIKSFQNPYHPDDRELVRILQVLTALRKTRNP